MPTHPWHDPCSAKCMWIAKQRLLKWGNSLGLRIPEILARKVQFVADRDVELAVNDFTLIIRRVELDYFPLEYLLSRHKLETLETTPADVIERGMLIEHSEQEGQEPELFLVFSERIYNATMGCVLACRAYGFNYPMPQRQGDYDIFDVFSYQERCTIDTDAIVHLPINSTTKAQAIIEPDAMGKVLSKLRAFVN